MGRTASPLQGVHPRRTGVPLPEAKPGPLTLTLEAASNPAFPSFRASPLGALATAGDAALYTLRRAELCLRDDDVFGLLLDVEVLLGLVQSLPCAACSRSDDHPATLSSTPRGIAMVTLAQRPAPFGAQRRHANT